MGLVKLLKTLNSVLGVERAVETDVKLQLAATAEQMEKFFNIMRSFDDGAKSVKVAKLHNVRAEAEELRLNTMSNAELTSLYNQKTGSTLKKFSTRAEGIARLKKVLEAEKQTPVQAPKASAIPVVGQNDKFSIAQQKAKLISELKSMTMAELVAVYNQLAIDPIKSFKTKADGVRRIEEQLILAKTCPQY
jgi:arsenate reductase-like glutaredoxin family protein